MNYLDYIGKRVHVVIDRPLGSCHPEYGFSYPVNYGFLPETTAGDGEEIDAYVLGVDKPLKTFDGVCIAVIHRLNDNEDKLVVVPDGIFMDDDKIMEKIQFQEKFFQSRIIRP